jgi:hypothetical protein
MVGIDGPLAQAPQASVRDIADADISTGRREDFSMVGFRDGLRGACGLSGCF